MYWSDACCNEVPKNKETPIITKYIKNLDLKYLENDVSKFEPRQALDGGLDGMSEIRKVVRLSSELIKLNGKLIIEIAHDQKEMVKKL